FVGEAVAVVVADSRYAAEDARALIDVAWEPLPSVQEATAPGAARVHDDLGDNLAGRVRLSRGDVTAALQSAPRRASLTLHVGRLLAMRDRFVHDTGAYTPRGLVVPPLSASMLAGPYRIPNIDVTFDSVYTHRVPVTPYRGAGQPQAVFVIERVMDLIARET